MIASKVLFDKTWHGLHTLINRCTISVWCIVTRYAYVLIITFAVLMSNTGSEASSNQHIKSSVISSHDSIAFAVFENQIKHYGIKQPNIFVSMYGRDVSPIILDKLSGKHQTIRNRSESAFKGPNLVNKATGVRGVWFNMSKIMQIGSRSAIVEGTVIWGRLQGYGIQYRVEKINTEWVVTKSFINVEM